MTQPSETSETINPMPTDHLSTPSIGVRKISPEIAGLESQLGQVPAVAKSVARKHWIQAEKEQYPFWIGMIFFAFIGIIAFIMREFNLSQLVYGFVLPAIMIVGLVTVIIYYLRSLQGRFERLWELIASDGRLYRFLRDASVVLGHPVVLGKPDEKPRTHLDLQFETAVAVTEQWLKQSAVENSNGESGPAGFYMPPIRRTTPSSGSTHRVYEAEYRGSINRALSIRVDSADPGSDVVMGFAILPANAETRDRLNDAVIGRIRDRLISAKILGEIREMCGLEPEPIPDVEDLQGTGGLA